MQHLGSRCRMVHLVSHYVDMPHLRGMQSCLEPEEPLEIVGATIVLDGFSIPVWIRDNWDGG